MNNGKVRIYELSRELNLDNKDILSICEGLNIAVKSHSSTITESEAQRIRTAAEKYSGSPKSRGGAATAEDNSGSVSTQLMEPPKAKRRQEIVGIVKPKSPRPISSSGQGGAPVATPPKSPVKPQATPPIRVNIEQPISKDKRSVDNQPPVKPTAQISEAPAVVNQVVEKPKLTSPPLRPTGGKPQLTQVERPVLKKDQKDASTPAKSSTPVPTKAKPVAANKQSKKAESSPSAKRSPSAPPVPKLTGPPIRLKPGAGKNSELAVSDDNGQDDQSQELEEGLIEDTGEELLELKIRRPNAPRPPKKKDWKKEIVEEEDKETSKAGKSSPKSKRRPERFLDDEDDDDLEGEQSSADTPVTVSLSVARPPKPKSRPGQSPSGSTPKTKEKKKPELNSHSGSHAGRDKYDRRRGTAKAGSELPDQIVLSGSMTIREMAAVLGIAETEIIKKLFFKGIAVNITQTLELETARMVAEDLGVAVETLEESSGATKETEWLDAADLEKLQRRPPVVTIMGHVDHGKTTLLDAIRETKVAQGEAGGITQHIGAYHVDVEHEGEVQQVVFLDTPGHEAFTAMRARGTRVTDIAVLVVAADDGVRPQTIEAISHAKAAEVPMVIAINKIDKAGAQPDRVKQELSERGLVAEEWGGDTIMVPVSAIQGENLETLLEMILLVSDIEELSANPERTAKGTVIEAHLDKARGPVATLLVQNGTLRVSDTLVAGSVFGKVRAMIDDRGERVEAAGPSFAVELLGLSDVPSAGDEFEVFESEKEARDIANNRIKEEQEKRWKATGGTRVTLTSLSAQAQKGELKKLNLILKADVQGSVEAIIGSLEKLPQNEVQIQVLLGTAGEITETDIDLAAASGAVIIGFSTNITPTARQAADKEGVDVREYNIIYKLLDDIQGAMEGLLEPELVEEPLGQVEVRAVFPVGRGAVAGCYVQSGKAMRNCNIRVQRRGKVIYEGFLDSLKRMKEDVKEVNAGFECGIGVDKFNDWVEGDIIETFKMVTKRRTLSLV
ncbi:MAG: translation initiation factor IF-2 [Symploca sp. SIO1A3]|nr:translation initiation factor IF-2 [Symploca sp. SIO2C1]NER51657.1 translation initiation factor IF-2 [Symploca sp. SIO1A3]